MKDLIRKKIHFTEGSYSKLKETSNASGDSFSIVIEQLIEDNLPEHYFADEEGEE